MTLVLQIAMTHIFGRLRQTIVSIAGVALGVGFSVAMAGLMEGSQRDFVTTLIDAIPHVQITDETRAPPVQPAESVFAAVAYYGLVPRDDRRGIRNPTEVTAVARHMIDGVMSANLTGQAVLRYSGRDLGLSITGADPADEARVSRKLIEGMREGSFDAIASAQAGIVIGTRAAEKVGAKLGDTVSVSSSLGFVKRFKIVGLFKTGVTAADEGSGYVSLKSAQILFDRPNAVNQIKIRLDDPLAARVAAERLEREIGYKSVSWQEANEDLLSAFQIRNIIMYTVVGAILLVAGFGIYNIVSTIVHEKARDIAILKSLGFPEGDMRRIFLIEGVVIGAVGSLAGSALGAALVLVLGSIRFEFSGGAIEVTHLPIYSSWVHYSIAGGFALASAAVAGYLPARKAAKVNPVDIIRGAT